MARWLRQSTSVDVPIGPFVDATDGVTAETALTITQPDIRLKKNGGAWAQKAAAQTLSHEENGNYEVTLDATDTNTLGLLRLHVAESGAMPIWDDFLVVPANVWDAFFGADLLKVDVASWTDIDLLTGAGRLPGLAAAIGTMQAVTDADTVRLDAASAYADSELIGQTLVIESGTGVGQSRAVLSNALTNDVVNLTSAFTTVPSAGRYGLYASPPAGIDVMVQDVTDMKTGWQLDGSVWQLTTNALELSPSAILPETGSTTSAGSTTAFIDTTKINAGDDAYKDALITWTSGTNTKFTCKVKSFVSTTGAFTTTANPRSIGNSNAYEIRPDSVAMLAAETHTGATVPTVSAVTAVSAGGITAASLASDTITSVKIADGALTAPKIADSALTNAKFADGAISNPKLADGVLTAPKIAADAFTAAKFHTDVTAELQTGLATAASLTTLQTSANTIAGYLDTEVAQIVTLLDTEVAAILAALTTARGEPGQGAPGVSISAVEKIDFLYKAWRNKITQTSSQFSLYADNNATVDHKATVSSDGVTLTRGEVVTGP